MKPRQIQTEEEGKKKAASNRAQDSSALSDPENTDSEITRGALEQRKDNKRKKTNQEGTDLISTKLKRQRKEQTNQNNTITSSPQFNWKNAEDQRVGIPDISNFNSPRADSNQPSQTTIMALNQSLRASDSESAALSRSVELLYKAKVHVWDTSFLARESGHVSLTLKKIGDDKNKSLHFGFWPERELTPYDALSRFNVKVKKSLDEEIHYSPDEPAWKPNKQYEISINKDQYKDMKKEINECSQKIELGQICYTWCAPFQNAIGSIYGSPNQLLENCSTSTTKILNRGKIPIKTGYAIWGITPSGVGNQLEKLITQNVILGEVIPVDDNKAREEDASTQQPKRENSATNLFNRSPKSEDPISSANSFPLNKSDGAKFRL